MSQTRSCVMPIRQRHIQGLTWKYIILLLLTKVIQNADRRLTGVWLAWSIWLHLVLGSVLLGFLGRFFWKAEDMKVTAAATLKNATSYSSQCWEKSRMFENELFSLVVLGCKLAFILKSKAT